MLPILYSVYLNQTQPLANFGPDRERERETEGRRERDLPARSPRRAFVRIALEWLFFFCFFLQIIRNGAAGAVRPPRPPSLQLIKKEREGFPNVSWSAATDLEKKQATGESILGANRDAKWEETQAQPVGRGRASPASAARQVDRGPPLELVERREGREERAHG